MGGNGGSDAVEVRDHRRPGWFWIDNEVLKKHGPALGPYGIAVYCSLAMHADNGTQECWPSIATIARQTGQSRRQVMRVLQNLKNLGLIEVRTRADRASNVYRLRHVARGGDSQAQPQEGSCLPVTTVMPVSHTNYTQELDAAESKDSAVDVHACPECSRPYKTPGGLTRHLKTKHGIDRVHPAVRAYIDIAGPNPPPGVRQMIIDKVGQEPGAVDRWREVVLAYCASGWNGRNVETMLNDYFDCGRIPKGGNGDGRSNHTVRGNGRARNESDWSAPDHGTWAPVLSASSGRREGDPVS